VVLTG